MENNKLIAEFMNESNELRLKLELFDYDWDWDRLMPVVEKICEEDNVTDFLINKVTGYTTIEVQFQFVICEYGEGIESVYKAVVEYIKRIELCKQS